MLGVSKNFLARKKVILTSIVSCGQDGSRHWLSLPLNLDFELLRHKSKRWNRMTKKRRRRRRRRRTLARVLP
jgi:hypothetical protein